MIDAKFVYRVLMGLCFVTGVFAAILACNDMASPAFALQEVTVAEPVDCGPCKAEWVSQTKLGYGNGECGHGPEYDPDCNGGRVPCCETAGNVPMGEELNQCTGPVVDGENTPGPDECGCFTCNAFAQGCEPMIYTWEVWCGLTGTGDCDGAPGVPDKRRPTEWIKIGTLTNPNVGCAFTSGFEALYPCEANPAPFTLGCKAPQGACNFGAFIKKLPLIMTNKCGRAAGGDDGLPNTNETPTL